MKIIGKGRTAIAYEVDDARILKLFLPGFPPAYIEKEYALNRYLNTLGLPMPQVFGIEHHNKQTGLVYERALGQTLLTLLFTQMISVKEASSVMAEQQTLIHQQLGPELPALKQCIFSQIVKLPITELQQTAIRDYLACLPDLENVCHLDYHPDNILFSDGKAVAIDWTNAHHGHPAADVCNSLITLTYSQAPAVKASQLPDILQMQEALKESYLERYIEKSGLTRQVIMAWWLPMLVFRYFYGPPVEKTKLLDAIICQLKE